MKKILIILLLLSGLINAETIKEKLAQQDCSSISNFSKSQIQYIIKSYIWGLPYGLEEVLPAIAWQESCLGLYKVNMYDPSAGLFHAYLPSVMARHNELKNNKFNRNKVAQMLINDDQFAVSEATSELLFWKNYYKTDRKKWNNYKLIDFMLMSYNRGTRWHKKYKDKISAKNYTKSVKYKMKKIINFINKYDIKNEINKIYEKN